MLDLSSKAAGCIVTRMVPPDRWHGLEPQTNEDNKAKILFVVVDAGTENCF